MTNMSELENELDFGTFGTFTSQQIVDSCKLEQALKVVVLELNLIKTENISLIDQIQNIQLGVSTIKEMYNETLSIMRKMGERLS